MWCCLPVCFGDGGCYFLARGGIPGHVPGHALLFSGSLINSVQAMPFSFQASVIFCTGEGLLRYGICVPCSKRLPPVRDAFSEAFGVKSRLLRYRMDIRYRKPPSLVRNKPCTGKGLLVYRLKRRKAASALRSVILRKTAICMLLLLPPNHCKPPPNRRSQLWTTSNYR